MSKVTWKPGTFLYPLPAVMVSCGTMENSNIITVAWTGIINTDPAMVYISVRPTRHSYNLIKETGEFVVNLTTEALTFATDYCGVKSGRDTDKWKDTGLTKATASKVSVPLIQESPVNLECKVVRVDELGSHHMFLAEVVAVDVDDAYFDEKDTFHLSKAKPMAYSHGRYYGLGEQLGTFGYSVRKKNDGQKNGSKKTGKRKQ